MLTWRLLYGSRVVLGQLTKETGVLQTIVAVGLGEPCLPPCDGDTLDTDGLSDFRLSEAPGDAKLLSHARRGKRVGIHQGIDSTHRIRHSSLHLRQRIVKRYTT